MRTHLLTAAKIVFVLLIFTALWWSGRISLDDIRFHPDRLGVAAAAVAVFGAACMITFVRWRLLLRGVEADLPLATTARLGLISMFFSTFLPGAFGGDLVKIAYVVRETHKRAEGAASVLVDRVCGLVGLLSTGVVAVAVFRDRIGDGPTADLAAALLSALSAIILCLLTAVLTMAAGRAWALGLLALLAGVQALMLDHLADSGAATRLDITLHSAGMVVLGLATVTAWAFLGLMPGRGLHSFVRRRIPLGDKVVIFIDAILAFRRHWWTLLAAVALSVMAQGLCVLGLAWFSHAMENAASTAQVFFAAPLAFVASAIPITPMGAGTGEAVYDQLLRMCRGETGAPIEGGAAVFLAYRLVQVGMGLVFGAPLYILGRREIADVTDALNDVDVEEMESAATPDPVTEGDDAHDA